MPDAPTPEELQEENKKLIEGLEKEEDTPPDDNGDQTPPEDNKEEDNKPDDSEPPKDDEEPKDEPAGDGEEPATPAPEGDKEPEGEDQKPKEEQPKPSPDFKEKFSASSRENQKINAKNRLVNQAIDEGNELAEPTEEELKEEYPDWDLLDATTKKIASNSLLAKKRLDLIAKAREKGKKIEKWGEEVTKYVEDPETLQKNPQLEGKTEAFKEFASEEKNNNVPFDLLVGAFLHEQSKNKKPTSNGKMFPDGSGGPNDKPTPKGKKKLSVEESEKLRLTNYDKYKEELEAGNIDNSVI